MVIKTYSNRESISENLTLLKQALLVPKGTPYRCRSYIFKLYRLWKEFYNLNINEIG
jgi:hypothetical protein